MIVSDFDSKSTVQCSVTIDFDRKSDRGRAVTIDRTLDSAHDRKSCRS